MTMSKFPHAEDIDVNDVSDDDSDPSNEDSPTPPNHSRLESLKT